MKRICYHATQWFFFLRFLFFFSSFFCCYSVGFISFHFLCVFLMSYHNGSLDSLCFFHFFFGCVVFFNSCFIFHSTEIGVASNFNKLSFIKAKEIEKKVARPNRHDAFLSFILFFGDFWVNVWLVCFVHNELIEKLSMIFVF